MLNFKIIKQLAKNDLRARYRGSVIGNLWLIVTPLVMLLIYSLVFSTIFKARWEALGADVYSSYAIVLFPGLMMYQLMMEVLQKGSTSYDNFSPITTKLNISVRLLLLGTVLAGLIPFWVTIAIWYLVVSILLSFSAQGFAVVLLTTLAFSGFCLGLALLSTVIGALLKDWLQLLAMLGMGILFISPVLYPVDHLPDTFQQIIYLNPLSHFVDAIRIGAFQPDLAPTHKSFMPVLLITILVLVAGVWLERVLERFMHE